MANDDILIVKDNQPFQPPRERIVVPRPIVDGLLTALHIRFCHPSRTQLKRIFNRYFFALDFDKASEATSVACHQCQAIKSIPLYLRPQSFTQAPTVVGSFFAADVIRRYRQYILVLRETVSSYTLSSLMDGERHDQLRNTLLSVCAELRLLGDNPITVRVDPAPGFVALVNDSDLARHGIRLEIGHVKNVNKKTSSPTCYQRAGYRTIAAFSRRWSRIDGYTHACNSEFELSHSQGWSISP